MKKFFKAVLSVCFSLLMLLFVACGNAPTTVEQARGKMENLGYTVSVAEYDEGEQKYTARVDCKKKYNGKTISVTALMFSSPTKAKEYMEWANKVESQFNANGKMRTVIGKWVVMGDTKARSDFKS